MTPSPKPQMPYQAISYEKTDDGEMRDAAFDHSLVCKGRFIPEAEAQELWRIKQAHDNKGKISQAFELGGSHFFHEMGALKDRLAMFEKAAKEAEKYIAADEECNGWADECLNLLRAALERK